MFKRVSIVSMLVLMVVLTVGATSALAASKPPTLAQRLAALETTVTTLQGQVADLTSANAALRARVADLEANPVLGLFTLTDGDIEGKPGPNLIYTGPQIWHPVELPGEMRYASLIDLFGPRIAPVLTCSLGSYVDDYGVQQPSVRCEWTRPVLENPDDPLWRDRDAITVLRATSPNGPWSILYDDRSGDSVQDGWASDQKVVTGQTFYYTAAYIEDSVWRADSYFNGNYGPWSEVVAVAIP